MSSERRTKRSRHARLVLMGVAPLVLTACEPEQPALLYSSVEECTQAGQLSSEECGTALASARAEHERVAPRYASHADCVADFGEQQCAREPHGSGAFMPFLGGFLLGRALDGRSNNSPYVQPVYRPRGGVWQAPDGRRIGPYTGRVNVDSRVLKPQPRAITMSRSGFGSRAAARGSSWGG